MDGTFNLPRTVFEQGQVNRVARRVAISAADGLLVYGNEAADCAARMIRSLRAAGCRESEIESLKEKLSDTFGCVQGALDKVLDDEGMAADCHQIDLSEVA